MILSRVVLAALFFASLATSPLQARAEADDPREQVAKAAESQIHQILDPLLEGYCQTDAAGMPSCKILQVSVQVDRESQAALAPGFDDIRSQSSIRLVPKSAQLRLLVDTKIGPVSRRKLLEIVDQYLSIVNFPVTVDARTASFPQPAASAGKIAVARDKVVREFKALAESVLGEYCGSRCVLGDVQLDAEPVNAEELQYGSASDLVQQDGIALRVGALSATMLMDESLSEAERKSIGDILKLKAASFKSLALTQKVMKFPTLADKATTPAQGVGSRSPSSEMPPGGSSTEPRSESLKQVQDSTTSQNSSSSSSQSSESSQKSENYSRIEKIERVENGDAVQAELQKFKFYGIIFAALVLSLLGVIAALGFRQTARSPSGPVAAAPSPTSPHDPRPGAPSDEGKGRNVAVRYEIERHKEDLSTIFAESPKVAKVVFSRILTEEGVETTSAYMQMFGESIVVDMLRDPSLQSDLNQLTEYYARNTIELSDQEQLDLLRKLHHRTVAGKLTVMGSRASNLFDFLVEMDGLQIAELVRTESMTVKAIVATQCDAMKRNILFQQLDDAGRIELMAELSRIDYLPRDYIHNVAQALKRKRRENPKLNTEALPGSEVLVGLLEKTNPETQRSVMKNLSISHPESARSIKGKLVSIETVRFLRENHMLDVLLGIKHDELLHFLRGVPEEVRKHVLAKAPKDLVLELEEELETLPPSGRDVYLAVERKVLNRIKLMAQEGTINLLETNERMFAELSGTSRAEPPAGMPVPPSLRRVA
jgi:flagellar motor switch protein FliG